MERFYVIKAAPWELSEWNTSHNQDCAIYDEQTALPVKTGAGITWVASYEWAKQAVKEWNKKYTIRKGQ